MKHTFLKSLMAAAVFVLAACGGGNVNAGEITISTPDGQGFGTQNVYKYEMYAAGGAYVKVTTTNGGSNLFVDGGVLAGHILQVQPQLVNVTGTNDYVDPGYAARWSCSNGKSIVSFQPIGAMIEVQDNCSFAKQIASKSK